jgi:integrase
MATSLKARAMLTLAYGCRLRASEVVRLRACDIDSEQMIIRIVQSKGRKEVPSDGNELKVSPRSRIVAIAKPRLRHHGRSYARR